MLPPKILVFVSAMLATVGCGSNDEASTAEPLDWSVGDGPVVPVSGKAHVFGPSGGASLEGATVSVMEAPELSTTVAEDGTFELEVPSGKPLSFVLEQPGFHENQSGTLLIGADGVTMLGFQAPTDGVFTLLALLADLEVDEGRCQISTTVSRIDTEPYGGIGLGEPDVVVSIDPPAGEGPIYFEYVSEEVIYPEPSLTATTIDGGVVFANVPEGEYRLVATKADKQFTPVDIRCRAGVLVNAAPPHGIQEI